MDDDEPAVHDPRLRAVDQERGRALHVDARIATRCCEPTGNLDSVTGPSIVDLRLREALRPLEDGRRTGTIG